MIDKAVVGRRLATLRASTGMTQKDFAKKIGVSGATLSDWENGKTELSYQTIFWYTSAFNVSSDYLLGLSDVPSYEHPSADGAVFSTKAENPGLSTGAMPSHGEKSVTILTDALPGNRRELEQLVRGLVEEALKGRKES